MKNVEYRDKAVLISGNGKLAFSVAVCLVQGGHRVTLYTENADLALHHINIHLADLKLRLTTQNQLQATERLIPAPYDLCIAITNEDIDQKKSVINHLEKILPKEATIAINTESIALGALQDAAASPSRIIGANWSEPAHTTMFLELIANEVTSQDIAGALSSHAKQYWKKDPYIIAGDFGIRAKMLSAITREAFFLVENGYASIEDIDRACRNDPGYYLSFAGNFRYMDLMGANGYGEVMKELNPELCKASEVPEFFANLIRQGYFGLENNKGFYEYKEGDAAKWEETFRKYSYQIKEIIKKYPFGKQEPE